MAVTKTFLNFIIIKITLTSNMEKIHYKSNAAFYFSPLTTQFFSKNSFYQKEFLNLLCCSSSPSLVGVFLIFFSPSVMLALPLHHAGTYEMCIFIFPGARIIDVLWTPGPKKGKIFILKLCCSVTRCVAFSPSQKDTSPSFIFNLIRIRSRRCCTCSALRSFAKTVHTPLLSPIHHTPRFGDSVNFFLRATASLHTPTTHEGLSPTITSHRC